MAVNLDEGVRPSAEMVWGERRDAGGNIMNDRRRGTLIGLAVTTASPPCKEFLK